MFFFEMSDFLINSFIIISVKDTMNLIDNMFKRENGCGKKCVTPSFNMHFKCKDEQPTRSILTINFIIGEKFKKKSSVLKNGYSALTKGTFRFATLEKHVGVKIWEKFIKGKKGSNRLHGPSLTYGPPSSTKKLLRVLEAANMVGDLLDVKSQLNPTLFGVGAPTEI